jgi:hypothetical protein
MAPGKEVVPSLAWRIAHACDEFIEDFGPCGRTPDEHASDADGIGIHLSLYRQRVGEVLWLFRLIQEQCPDKELVEEMPLWIQRFEALLVDLTPPVQHKGPWVYFIQCGPYIKIGLSGDVGSRLKALQTSTPYPLTLLNKIIVINAMQVEAYLHGYFADYRRSGEWFALTARDISWVSTVTGFEVYEMMENGDVNEEKPQTEPDIHVEQPVVTEDLSGLSN